jgi:hypothetical protein
LNYQSVTKFAPPAVLEGCLFEMIEELYNYLEDFAFSVVEDSRLGNTEYKETTYTDVFSEAKAGNKKCSVTNPDAPYKFDVPTPVSKRLASLIAKEDRTNAALVNVTFHVAAVLHYIVNDRESWAYKTNERKIFRSSDDIGIIPAVFNDMGINPDNIFRTSIESLRTKARQFILLK